MSTIDLSGNPEIDGILWGYQWDAQNLGYVFTVGTGTYQPFGVAGYESITGYEALNADQEAAVVRIFANVANFTDLTFTEFQTNGATVAFRFAEATTIDYSTVAGWDSHIPGSPNDSAEGNPPDPTGVFDYAFGDIWFNRTNYNTPTPGSFAYAAGFMHELGHGLGLAHGHATQDIDHGDHNHTKPMLPADHDSQEYSVMTYRGYPGAPITDGTTDYPQTYMMNDIAALQYMYGANYATANTGATTYRWAALTAGAGSGELFINGIAQGLATGGHILMTIWDGGGNDTYDFSNYTTALVVDLNPGAWTTVDANQLAELGPGGATPHPARGNIANAYLFGGDSSSLIENAIGGNNNDWLKGNQAGNNLQGLGGNDTLEGFDGHDILDQGDGGGGMYGGDDNDTLIAGPDVDYIDGGNDYDTVDYSRSTSEIQIDTTIGKVLGGWATGDTLVSIEKVIGTNYGDNIAMGDAPDTVEGGNGADRFDGRGGDDVLLGYAGNDVLRGGIGGDFLGGGSDFDIATFAAAVTIDLQSGARGGEAVGDTYVSIEQFNGSPESDAMVASNLEGARFAGANGTDYLYGGDQGDWLQGGQGTDYLSGGAGNDTVSYADAPNGITVEMYFQAGTSLGDTDGKIIAGDWGLDTLVSIESVEGTAYHDYMLGDERANTFDGLGGDDYLQGDQTGARRGRGTSCGAAPATTAS